MLILSAHRKASIKVEDFYFDHFVALDVYYRTMPISTDNNNDLTFSLSLEFAIFREVKYSSPH